LMLGSRAGRLLGSSAMLTLITSLIGLTNRSFDLVRNLGLHPYRRRESAGNPVHKAVHKWVDNPVFLCVKGWMNCA
jgi:hypothetical protein